VTIAGVLLVFSFLIIPAVIGTMFSDKVRVVLPIAWGVGVLASAVGLAGSYALDLPTGAAMVAAFALFLVIAGLAKVLVFVETEQRRVNQRVSARVGVAVALTLTLASSLWLIINPAADQPLAAVFERATGLGPARFLGANERGIYESAGRDMLRFQAEGTRLDAMEKAARFQGEPLADEEIRRIASYQQSFNEMTRGEQFVQDVLRRKARARERWIVGLPMATICLLGLGLIVRPFSRHRWSNPNVGEREASMPSVVA
jgi:zinc/manganese transport system permease protein